MVTLQIELDEQLYARLKAAAEQRALPVAAYVLAMAAAAERQDGPEAGQAAEMARAHLQKYPRLFERLAE